MPKAERTILSTRPLPASLVLEAASRGFEVNCLSFIETEPVVDDALSARIQALATGRRTVLFTSMNAVTAVANELKQRPDWTVYCIGHSTRDLVEKELGLPVAGTADDAVALADVVLAAGECDIVFFCGDIRREALPVKLREAGVQLEELIVYHTISTPQRVAKAYRAILFFSPSAVDSFFKMNKPGAESVLFAIGRSTAEALAAHSNSTVVTAKQPGKEALLREAMHYFENHIPKQIL